MQSSIPINVVGAPNADFALPVPACPNIAAPFNGTISGNSSPVATWNWNFNPGTATGQNATFTFPNIGTYNVSLSTIGAEGCVDTTTKAVLIGNGPAVNIVPDSLGVCPGDNATFTIQNPVAGATYEWFANPTGGNPVATGTSFTINNINAPVSYYVESSLSGCVSTTRKRVQVTVRPALATPVAIVDSVGTNLIRFRWSAIVGATAYEVTTNGGTSWVTPSSGATGLTHTVTGLQVGQTVTLQVRALGGCLPATSQAVTGQTVTDQIYIPNAFTPNGDGLNDQLRVYSNVIRTMRFTVFNQWGEKIFESTSQANAWDGTYKNKQQPSGVYMYVCDITLVDGTRVQRKGSINLVR
jgi:gliding motility-associated-like protein